MFSPPAKIFGVGNPMNEILEPSVPPRIGLMIVHGYVGVYYIIGEGQNVQYGQSMSQNLYRLFTEAEKIKPKSVY